MDIKGIMDNLKVGAVASDASFNIIYINKRGKELSKLKGVLDPESLMGSNIQRCHKPETKEKLMNLYQEYREKKRSLYYYVVDLPSGKATVVNVPFYDGDELAGVVEFIFESALG